ncbi:thermosome subunit alpha [Halorientalis salina]|uniref:thermosome subunit alpha n=1 Tax=Halorientalis salina TaxID=2932266 RepID=UPI0010AC8A84|nr:thermosome subunit alpha [Halorientalis salina]
MTQSAQGSLTGILGEGSERFQGRDVRETNITAGKVLADTVKSTLGPRGMDKMLVGEAGKVVVTNDGASILDRMDIEHPAARALVQVAEGQQNRIGDGTTSAVLLAGELLAEAADLLEDGLYPTTIETGYRLAVEHALTAIDSHTVPVDPTDTELLLSIASTAVTGKWTDEEAQALLELVVDAAQAVERNGTVERRRITRTTVPGGSPTDSKLVDGLAIDMDASSTTLAPLDIDLPRRIEDARVALVDDQLTVEKADAITHVSVENPQQLDEISDYESDVYEGQASGIADAGADVVFCQKSIDDEVLARLAEKDIIAVERTRQDEMHKLARATGAEMVMRVDELTPNHVGRAGEIERRTIAGTDLVVVGDCSTAEQRSLVFRGGTEHVIAETKRLVENCLDDVTLAVEEAAVVPGGGAIEVAAASSLRETADGIAGREQLAVSAFADALEVIPRTLATSAGLDPIDTLVELRNRHHRDEWRSGLDVVTGEMGDMVDRGVVEPASVKRHAIPSATDAATLLLGIDDMLPASSAEETAHGHDDGHDHDHGHGGLEGSGEGYPWTIGH